MRACAPMLCVATGLSGTVRVLGKEGLKGLGGDAFKLLQKMCIEVALRFCL